MSHRLLLDTSSLMYRAYFALPRTIRDPDGSPVNAVHGYLDMTARLISSRSPDEVVHVYDHDWRPARRVERWPGYKAARPPDPEGLPKQFDVLREVLSALGQPQAEAEGWEADDALGALCSRANADDRIEVVTGDRDLLQLVRDPSVSVLFTVKGVSELAVFDERAVRAKYGVEASRYVEFAILRGDPSDGLPGVRGVGEKTACALVSAYDSLDALLADARLDPPEGLLARHPRAVGAIREAEPYIEAMRWLVPVRSDVDVRVLRGVRDDDRLDALAARHGLAGPVRRLREALNACAGGDASP